MHETWFTSDHHFGHNNMRSFEPSRLTLGDSIEEHDEALIARWNEKVRPGDRVYHLGDFGFLSQGRFDEVAAHLNGRVKMLLGNHDRLKARVYSQHFEVTRQPYTRQLAGTTIVLTHAPLHPSCLDGRWALNVHGHTHSRVVQLPGSGSVAGLGPDPRYLNVSVEQTDFYPLHINRVVARLRDLAEEEADWTAGA